MQTVDFDCAVFDQHESDNYCCLYTFIRVLWGVRELYQLYCFICTSVLYSCFKNTNYNIPTFDGGLQLVFLIKKRSVLMLWVHLTMKCWVWSGQSGKKWRWETWKPSSRLENTAVHTSVIRSQLLSVHGYCLDWISALSPFASVCGSVVLTWNTVFMLYRTHKPQSAECIAVLSAAQI